MQTQNSNQEKQCDYCSSPAIFKVINASQSDESISCEVHKKEALESMENGKK